MHHLSMLIKLFSVKIKSVNIREKTKSLLDSFVVQSTLLGALTVNKKYCELCAPESKPQSETLIRDCI